MPEQRAAQFPKRLVSWIKFASMPAIASASLVLSVNTGASAKDLMALVDILTPAYVALTSASACAQDDRDYLARTSGIRGSVVQFVVHMKRETTSYLQDDEATAVMTNVARSAQKIATEELRKQAPDYPVRHPGELTTWCQSESSEMVRGLIARHEQKHAVLIREIDEALQR